MTTHKLTDPTQLARELPRVLDRVTAEVIVEIRPHAGRIVLADAFRPCGQLFARIIMAIPSADAMKPDIDFIARLNEFIGQARRAA